MAHPYFDVPTPIVIGHRGAAGERPENTLPSFEHALAQGAAILETDAHATKDGEIVLAHDPFVDRITEGCGAIAELTLAELKCLDAGYRFTLDGGATFPFRGQGIRIATLAEAFEAFPEARFNIELKDGRNDLVQRAVDLVVKSGRESRTLLAAASDSVMASLRSRLESSGAPIATSASAGDVLAFVRAAQAGEAPPAGPLALQIPAQFGGQSSVTPLLLAHAHDHGLQVHVWTVNDPAEMRDLLERGVDGIISDLPGVLAAVIAERKQAD